MRKEQFRLIRSQVHSLLEITSIASENTIQGNWLLEEEIERRLLSACLLVKKAYDQGRLTLDNMKDIADSHQLYRLMIVNSDGEIRLSSNPNQGRKHVPEQIIPTIRKFLKDSIQVSSGDYFQSPIPGEFRYALFYRLTGSSVIIVNIDASLLLDFRKKTGFGSLINNITENENILYAALQDTGGIIAASRNVKELDRIFDNPELFNAYQSRQFHLYESGFNGQRVLEAVHPLVVEKEMIGLFRIGISMEPLELIRRQSVNRMILSSIMIIVLGGFLILILLGQQRVDLMKRQYDEVETFSQSMLTHISDGVLIVDSNDRVVLMNQFFTELVPGVENKPGENLKHIFPEQLIDLFKMAPSGLSETKFEWKNLHMVWMISKNRIGIDDRSFLVYVIRDVTEKYRLEEQIVRRERLAAMGQLASGVAHEIRNPLNAIATLSQQIKSDFTVTGDNEEFQQLMEVILREINRLNNTVEHFLKLARPEPLQKQLIVFDEFMKELEQQFKFVGTEKNIHIQFRNEFHGAVEWDVPKMKQVMINLVNNAIQACGENDEIRIISRAMDATLLQISVEDTGAGMDENVRSKIFNAYYTTRPEGTGLGLSIVQQIVDLHDGTISVQSEEGKGTVFELQLPVIVGSDKEKKQ
ncbi:MAG: hypothetical protein Kow00108_20580 [Calditrichia bacterium]